MNQQVTQDNFEQSLNEKARKTDKMMNNYSKDTDREKSQKYI
jgi:hypothetical protein